MTISFNNIPATLRTPGVYVEYDNSRAVTAPSEVPELALIIGQRLSAGTVAEDVPTLVESAAAGETYFGHGSQIAHMIEAFKRANPYTELWAIAMDDEGAGTAATGTITFSGTSTEAGYVYLYMSGERVAVAIPNGTAAAAVGPLVVTAANLYLQESNVSLVASGPAAVTTFTSLHKGTLGNDSDIRLNYQDNETLPAGITAVVVNMGDAIAGATDPPLSGPIAVFADKWWTTIISSLADDTNMDLLETEMDTRWGPLVQQDAHAFIGVIGNQATLTTAGNARNSKHTVLMGGGLSPTAPWVWASVAGAVDALESDPARPRQTLELVGCLPPPSQSVFTQTERATLLADGVSTFTVTRTGECLIERLITTYQTNALSNVDTSYLNQTTMRTLAYIRYTWRARVQQKFPRHKLADDGTLFAPGQAVVTPSILRAEALALFRDTWEPAGIVEGWEQFKKDLIVERNASDPDRVDLRMSPDLINQFRVLAGQIQFLL
jgi:phage tail sheath gpL-like